MEDKICLDSDFLINLLRNKDEEVNFIREHENKCILATTYVNLFELYYGVFKSGKIKEVLMIEILKNRINILNLDDNIVRKAGEIAARLDKLGKPIEFRDLFIGAISMINNFSLKTYNVSDFSRIPGLQLI